MRSNGEEYSIYMMKYYFRLDIFQLFFHILCAGFLFILCFLLCRQIYIFFANPSIFPQLIIESNHNDYHLMIKKTSILALILFLAEVITQADKKCCESYDKTNALCLTCPLGSFLSGNNCIIAIEGCQNYINCFSCSACSDGYKLVDDQFNGQPIKKCQQMTQYTEVDIINTDAMDIPSQAYLVVDDFERSSHRELENAETLNGQYLKYANGTQVITIQYSIPQDPSAENKYVRASMIVDLTTYIFKQTEYTPINKADIRQPNQRKGGSSTSADPSQKLILNTTGLIGPVTTKQNYTEKNLIIFAADNQALLRAADLIAQGSPQIYKGLNSIKLQTYQNDSQYLELNYTKNDSTTQIILIQVAGKRVVSVNGVPTIQTAPINPTPKLNTTNTSSPVANISSPAANASSPVANISSPAANASSPVANISSPAANASSPVANISSPAANASSPVANISSPAANASSPAAPGNSSNNATSNRTLGITNATNISNTSNTTVNSNSSIDKVTTNITANISPNPTSNITTNTTINKINSSTANLTTNIPSNTTNLSNSTNNANNTNNTNMTINTNNSNITTKTNFTTNNITTNSSTNSNSTVPSINITNSTLANSSKPVNNISISNITNIAKNSSNTSTNNENKTAANTTVILIGNYTIVANNSSSNTSNISNTSVAVTKNITNNITNSANTTNNATVPNITTTTNNTNIPTLQNNTTLIATNTTAANNTINITPASNTTTNITVPNTATNTAATNITTSNTTTTNTNTNTNTTATNTTATNTTAVPITPVVPANPVLPPVVKQLSPKIISLTAGYTQLTTSQMITDPNYLKVEALVKSVQSGLFTSGRLIGAFVKATGFIRYYKVYIQTIQRTFQAYIANDGLRNRVYLLTFGPIE